MAKYGNENAATGGTNSSTKDRDRQYGGGWGGDHGGGNGPQGAFGPRYSPTVTRQYQATPSNLAKLLGGAAMGLAMPGIGIGLGPMVGDMMGMGYTDFQGYGHGWSYDNKGMDYGQPLQSGAPMSFSSGRAAAGYGRQNYLKSLEKAAKIRDAAKGGVPRPSADLQQATWPAQSLYVPQQTANVPGLSPYGVTLPAFNYWKRP